MIRQYAWIARTVSTIFLLTLFGSQAAHTQELYAGFSIGGSDFDASQFGETEPDWSAQVGLDLNRFLAVELAYTDHQQLDSRISGQFQPNPKSYALTGIVRYPLLNRVDVYARAGYATIDTEINSYNPSYNGSQNDHTPIYGAGLKVSVTDNWSARVSAERMELDMGVMPVGSFYTSSEGKLDRISAGIILHF